MILTRGPDDVCLGEWYLLTEDAVSRFPTLTRAVERLHDTQRKLRQPREPARLFFVHWSLLSDEERGRVFSASRA